MDEMKLKLTTSFMKSIAAKLISRFIYKKFGCKATVKLNDLDVWVINGDADIRANVEIKINSNEFMKIVKSIDED